MYYGNIKGFSIENGVGVRVSLFVSGCRNHCKNCFSPQTWNFTYGEPFTEETEKELLEELAPDHIHGLTILGGEPFEPQNQPAIVELLREVKGKYPQKSIWAFSGYLYEKITSGTLGDWNITKEYLSYLDVLVDGPFIMEKKNLALRFRGSENQRIIDVPATLRTGKIVLWQDWQSEGKGMR